MHAMSTDSEVTSLTTSSPGRSPALGRAVYYVQSPSRDSHDDTEKAPTSTHSTPALMSPMASPRHSHSSAEHQSRGSSTRFSSVSSTKPRGSCRTNVAALDGAGRKLASGRRRKGGDQFAAIEEEGLLEGEEEEEDKGFHRRCYFVAFLLGFAVLFSVFSLILWGASRSQKPEIVMKSIKFENFFIQAGIDAGLVPTDMATLNSTVHLTFRNTGTFFGIHVSSTTLDLAYNQLVLASGSISTFYQSRRSKRSVDVVVLGKKVPLYGGGQNLAIVPGRSTYPPIPLELRFMVKARAYVLGRLVKPKFHIAVQCSVTMDETKLSFPVSLKNSCQYY